MNEHRYNKEARSSRTSAGGGTLLEDAPATTRSLPRQRRACLAASASPSARGRTPRSTRTLHRIRTVGGWGDQKGRGQQGASSEAEETHGVNDPRAVDRAVRACACAPRAPFGAHPCRRIWHAASRRASRRASARAASRPPPPRLRRGQGPPLRPRALHARRKSGWRTGWKGINRGLSGLAQPTSLRCASVGR